MHPQAACIGLFGTSVKLHNHTVSVQLLSVGCLTEHFYTITSICTRNQHYNTNDSPSKYIRSNKVRAESTCKIIFGFRNGHYTRTSLRADLVYTIMVYVNCFTEAQTMDWAFTGPESKHRKSSRVQTKAIWFINTVNMNT